MQTEFELRPLRRVTLVESIIEQILAFLQERRLEPGTRLPSEYQLMQMLGVSRPSVREALHALAAMGVIEVRVGQGTFVKERKNALDLGPDLARVSLILQKEMRLQHSEARRTLEEGIAGLAAMKITPAGAQNIQRAVERYAASVERDRTGIDWEAHNQVHLSLAEATGNPFLVRMLKNLLELITPWLRDKDFLKLPAEERERQMRVEVEAHRELGQAVINGDGAAARACIWRHAEREMAFFGGGD